MLMAGIHGGIDFVMMRAGVHDENLGSLVGLLHHVGQVMAIVLGQGGAEDDKIEGVAAQGLLNALAVEGGGHVMTGFGHFGGLGGECGFVGLSVKNLDGRLRERVSGAVAGKGPPGTQIGA